MSQYPEDEYLMISGIQHFVFCKRQWALIHIEQQWEENLRTVEGNIMHENVHNSNFTEKRNDKITVRAMAVSSPILGISGECDAVEFVSNQNGIELFGRQEKYLVTPIEYKRGKPKENDSDAMQLCAQAMCLEHMLCCEIPVGYIYYGMTNRRLKVDLNDELRKKLIDAINEMHKYYTRKHTPKVKRNKSCNACSLKNLCLPTLMKNKSASNYFKKTIGEMEP